MITPAQHLPAAKATVTAEDDPHLWPHLPQSFDQQRQNRPAVFGTIDVARTKIAHQQLMTAEYIQWQKTVVPVIAVKEATVLFTVYRVIGGRNK